MSNELMGRIERWAEENAATRSEAIRRLVELGLKVKARSRDDP
jgi:metal-responsive CopG/Arc/MetJ family transcriptional regulator